MTDATASRPSKQRQRIKQVHASACLSNSKGALRVHWLSVGLGVQLQCCRRVVGTSCSSILRKMRDMMMIRVSRAAAVRKASHLKRAMTVPRVASAALMAWRTELQSFLS